MCWADETKYLEFSKSDVCITHILASCVKLLTVLHVSTTQRQVTDLYEVWLVKEADRRCRLVVLLH